MDGQGIKIVSGAGLVHALQVGQVVQAGRAPLWLHEGVAQVCEQIHDPDAEGLRGHREMARMWAQGGLPPRDFRRMLTMKRMLGSDVESYAMAYSMVEWMVSQEPRLFRKLLDLTKKGVAPKEALETALGAELAQLEAHWLAYVRAEY